ncbi:MAG TPA: HAD-IIA family hydrolase [Acidimicrobiales bacterium]|nr:HAD-IIA family hydrolase [Acidimicrobiales bacterium]
MPWVLDLDGVVWLADDVLPGAPEAVARIRSSGERIAFVTNNSSEVVGTYVDKLGRMGIPVGPDDVITSAQAAAAMVEPGQRVMCCGGDGVVEALTTRGVEVVDGAPADAVMVGWHRSFDYDELTRAMRAVRAGAVLIGTNDDPSYPIPGGLLPGGGALVAAVAYASECEAQIAGKPHVPMVDLIAARVGAVEWVIGDRPSTDGRLAAALGARFGLVLSGVATQVPASDDSPPTADVAADLAALVGVLLPG